MDRVLNVFKHPKDIAFAASGIILLGCYYFYGRKVFLEDIEIEISSEKLQMSLQELVKTKKDKSLFKIVFTESAKTKLEFRSHILSETKKILIENQFITLVNCSPMKLLNSGCECLLQSIDWKDEEDDETVIKYLENAIKCQLMIERTISDIETIKKQGNEKVFLLCDTNSLDAKVGVREEAWNCFLKKNEISCEQIKQNYDVVFHVIDKKESQKEVIEENKEIARNWATHMHYFQIEYNPDIDLQENIHNAIEKIKKALLPSNLSWK